MYNNKIGTSTSTTRNYTAPAAPLSLLGALALCLLPAAGASATQVQSALPEYQVGISVADLLAFVPSDLPPPEEAARPPTMGDAGGGIHLGTNTDIFAVGATDGLGRASEFWVRYTLDPTSHFSSTSVDWSSPDYEPYPTETWPVSGALWLSFDLTSGSFGLHPQQLGEFNPFYGSGYFNLPPNQASVSALYDNWNGNYESPLNSNNAYLGGAAGVCLECSYSIDLNLAFLDLRWNGTRYDLYTSAVGYDQILGVEQACWSLCGWKTSTALNVAPVPVPGAAWLFGSGLAGVVAMRRRRVARLA